MRAAVSPARRVEACVVSVIYRPPLYCATADLGNGHPVAAVTIQSALYWLPNDARNIQLPNH